MSIEIFLTIGLVIVVAAWVRSKQIKKQQAQHPNYEEELEPEMDPTRCLVPYEDMTPDPSVYEGSPLKKD